MEYHCSTSEKQILKDLNTFAYDPEETSGYHGNLTFHRNIVCKNREEAEKTFSVMSLFQIDKIVYDENENINDKLVSVYSALSNFGSTALLLIDSDEGGVNFFLGTRDTKGRCLCLHRGVHPGRRRHSHGQCRLSASIAQTL